MGNNECVSIGTGNNERAKIQGNIALELTYQMSYDRQSYNNYFIRFLETLFTFHDHFCVYKQDYDKNG